MLIQSLFLGGLLGVVGASSFSFAQTNSPQRIVSLSLCSDQLLILLADKNKIQSLSYLSTNPKFSFLAQEALGFSLNHGKVEEILPLKPDLIISSQFSASSAVSILKRLGHNVSVLELPNSLDGSYAQIREVANLIGEPERAENLILEMQNAITQSLNRSSPDLKNKTAVFYATNGFSFGENTLRNDFLERLGMKNIATSLGMTGSGQLSLEALIQAKPDFLFIDQANDHSNNLAHPMLKHPALQQLFPKEALITMPDILFQCAGPSISQAFALMESK